MNSTKRKLSEAIVEEEYINNIAYDFKTCSCCNEAQTKELYVLQCLHPFCDKCVEDMKKDKMTNCLVCKEVCDLGNLAPLKTSMKDEQIYCQLEKEDQLFTVNGTEFARVLGHEIGDKVIATFYCCHCSKFICSRCQYDSNHRPSFSLDMLDEPIKRLMIKLRDSELPKKQYIQNLMNSYKREYYKAEKKKEEIQDLENSMRTIQKKINLIQDEIEAQQRYKDLGRLILEHPANNLETSVVKTRAIVFDKLYHMNALLDAYNDDPLTEADNNRLYFERFTSGIAFQFNDTYGITTNYNLNIAVLNTVVKPGMIGVFRIENIPNHTTFFIGFIDCKPKDSSVLDPKLFLGKHYFMAGDWPGVDDTSAEFTCKHKYGCEYITCRESNKENIKIPYSGFYFHDGQDVEYVYNGFTINDVTHIKSRCKENSSQELKIWMDETGNRIGVCNKAYPGDRQETFPIDPAQYEYFPVIFTYQFGFKFRIMSKV